MTFSDTSAAPLFDGHNDVLSKLARAGGRAALEGFARGREGGIDLPKARAGGMMGGLFAVWVPSDGAVAADYEAMMERPPYDVPLAERVPQPHALGAAMAQVALLLEMDRRGDVALCRSLAQIEAARAAGRLAAVLHVEGAEAIGPDLDVLDVLHAAGLRSLGPVWSRPTIFGHGVPFRFPSDAEIGDGLTPEGEALVRRCDALGIMIDMAHLNAAGFRDVMRVSSKPLVVTHSNAHAVTPHSRNLTDWQLDAIAETGGMVGVNFATSFLRADGRKDAATPLADVLRHLDHLIERLGEDHVGFGSDYDGAQVPQEVADVGRFQALRDSMSRHGYDAGLIAKLCHANWLGALGRAWHDDHNSPGRAE